VPNRRPSLPTAQSATPPPTRVATALAAHQPTKLHLPATALFIVSVAASLLVFRTPLRIILSYPIWTDNSYDKYCYTIVVPFFSLMVVFLERQRIFSNIRYSFRTGTLVLLAGIGFRLIAAQIQSRIGVDSYLFVGILGLVVFWMGGFILCYGPDAFHAAGFPLLLLLLTPPLPDFLLDKLIVTVQYGSANVGFFIFKLFGVPVLRNGLVFYLPDVAIEVEKECSGIHSTMAMLLVSLVAAHLFLVSRWKKVFLVVLAVPIVCVSNGLRIAVLTLLAQNVDRSFLFGRLHHQGGVLFFALALLLLYLILQVLRSGSPVAAPHRAVSPPPQNPA
jgi:exosortase